MVQPHSTIAARTRSDFAATISARSFDISAGRSEAPGVSSPGATGTRLGIWTNTLLGIDAAFVVHQPYAGQTQHVGDLMGIDEHRRGAVGITARQNSETVNMPLSTCMCPSQSPGTGSARRHR
jgi:hypothetical protein